jgi:hypothetical protein
MGLGMGLGMGFGMGLGMGLGSALMGLKGGAGRGAKTWKDLASGGKDLGKDLAVAQRLGKDLAGESGGWTWWT